MKYIVTRTSNWGEEDPKVKGVQKEILTFKYDSYYGNLAGKEELREVYTIDLDSLDSLHQFITECKHHIVLSNPSKDGSGFQLPKIKIYDDYRE